MSEFDFGAEYAAFGDDLKGTAYEGEYTMRVVKAKSSQTQKGKQQFLLNLAFTEGPLAAKGKTVDDRLVWSPESDVAARIFAQSLRILGATQEWIMAERPSPEQIAERITGAVVKVKLSKGEFNGQPQTNVNYRQSVSVKDGPSAPTGAAAAAVSLDDEPATPAAAAKAAATAEPTSNPWADVA